MQTLKLKHKVEIGLTFKPVVAHETERHENSRACDGERYRPHERHDKVREKTHSLRCRIRENCQ